MIIKNFIVLVLLFFSLSVNGQNNSYNFYAIDRHADNAPSHLKDSIPALVNYLSETTQNDLQKVRALFRWISQNIDYDVDAYFERRLIVEDPAQVIKRGTAVCGGYAQLLKRMCSETGIECEIVSGWSKGYNEQLSERPNHAWNAVKINKQWHLLDVTWGSGHINDQQTYTKSFQEHYFLTDPKLLIYDHYPEDEKWQQLKTSISLREFENLILLRPNFFKTGLTLLSHKDSQIHVKDELVVKMAAPDSTFINAELVKNNGTLPDHFVFSQRLNDEYLINVHFPDEGKYILRVYSKSGKAEKLYHWACDYNINVQMNVNSNPFTKPFASFYDLEGYIFYPLDLFLNSNEDQKFKIKVNNVLEVSLLLNENKIIPLKKAENIYSTNIKAAAGPLRIMAKADKTDQYQFLLEYHVK